MEDGCDVGKRRGVKRRKKVISSCPNPVFVKWLTEWKDEAEKKQWKTKYVYDKALKSLKKYPLTLRSGRECKILEFFGDKICEMIDDRLSRCPIEFLEENALRDDPVLELPVEKNKEKKRKDGGIHTKPTKGRIEEEALGRGFNEERTGARAKDYVPAFRSGPYALLMTLYKAKQEESIYFMSKSNLVDEAQPFCDKSFKVPEPGSHYTAWSSMGTLIKKGLVIKQGNPARYSLTDSGVSLVAQMMEVEMRGTNDPSPPPSSVCARGSFSVQRPSEVVFEREETPPVGFKLLPGQFDIVLCVDNCETVSGGSNLRKQQVQTELRKNGVNFDVRKLHVGDFVWIAREKVLPVFGQVRLPEAKELVLDYIVERKRKDDLANSITDGRFKEQKSRMKSCFLRNPIYLIEECGSNNHFAIPESTLIQAVTNTQIVDGFTIKQTKNLAESVNYLTIVTRYLQSLYSGKILFSCSADDRNRADGETERYRTTLLTFDEFNSNSMKIKPLSATELFFKQLLQLNGISEDRGKAIVELYPTPLSLIQKFKGCGVEREKALSVVMSKSGRNLGPVLSKVLCQFYTKTQLI